MISVQCASCNSNFTAPDHAAGRVVNCPKCKSRLPIPTIGTDDILATLGKPDTTPRNEADDEYQVDWGSASIQPPPVSVPPSPPSPPPAAPQIAPPAVRIAAGARSKRSARSSPWYWLDLGFERYLTPIIIRITWVLMIVATILGLALASLGHVLDMANSAPHREVVAAELAVEQARSEIEALESLRRQSSTDRSWPNPSPRSRQPQFETPERETPERTKLDPLEAARQRLAAAEQRLAKAQAEHPHWRQVLDTLPGKALYLTLEGIAALIGILWIRVLLELGIVLFNIASKVDLIEAKLK